MSPASASTSIGWCPYMRRTPTVRSHERKFLHRSRSSSSLGEASREAPRLPTALLRRQFMLKASLALAATTIGNALHAQQRRLQVYFDPVIRQHRPPDG